MIDLTRRSILAAPVALAVAPHSVSAREIAVPSGSLFDLRGVRVGGHAILRTSGTVACDATSQLWRFAENAVVSWTARDAATVIERREGRIQITAPGDRTVEIATGPVEEILSAGAPATVLQSGGASRLLVTAATLTASDAWDILEYAALPARVPEFRVFSAIDPDTRGVFWGLRSPWLADLDADAPGTRLIWRGAGRLSAWRGV